MDRLDEDELTRAVVALAAQYGRYGYRRITALLQSSGWPVGKDRVQRIWRREGLKVPQKQRPRRRLWLNGGSCVRLRPEHRNHVWSYDFVSARTHDGRTLRLLTLLDEVTRECLAIRVERRIGSPEVIETLSDVMLWQGVPEPIRSDNGPAGFAYSKDWVLKAGLMLSDIGRVGFKVDNFNRQNMEVLESRWSEIKDALTLTVELVSSFGFSSATLRSDSALLPIAYYLFAEQVDDRYLTDRSSEADREAIRQWLIASLLKPSGIWGSGLDTLLTALRKVIRQGHDNFPTRELRETMRSRGKSLAFNTDEIDDLTEMRFGDKRTFSLLSLVFPHLDLR